MKKPKLNEQDFRPMVWKLAVGAWRLLPRSVQYWMDMEDLAAEGMNHLCCVLIPKYDAGKKFKPSTYIHVGLRNHLFNIVNSHRQKKRIVPETSPYVPSTPPVGAQRYESAQGLRYVYSHASPLLKRELRRLFSAGTRGQRYRWPVDSTQELKDLCARAHINHSDLSKLSHAGYFIDSAR